ncbi:MAG TPA: DUF2283 domain-containing protein [Acidimicrobiia bacterium]|nr:DUF2283 domain-containing protein [Acidimicrobiia bacterium]
MRWTYDLSGNALYIYVQDRPVSGQVEMADGTVVDVDEHGMAVGIEVLSPEQGWDVDAVLERFHLDDDAKRSLGFILMSPLLMRTPPRRERTVDVTTTGERPAEPATNVSAVLAA